VAEMNVTDALNTHNYAIDILTRNGYRVYMLEEDEEYIIYVEKNKINFHAEDPLALLALVFIEENGTRINGDRKDLYLCDLSSLSLKVLLDREFKLTIASDFSSDWYDFVARKDDNSFFASSPLKLLGLVLMLDHFGESWLEIEVPFYLNDLC
jgi:hypothetical protein